MAYLIILVFEYKCFARRRPDKALFQDWRGSSKGMEPASDTGSEYPHLQCNHSRDPNADSKHGASDTTNSSRTKVLQTSDPSRQAYNIKCVRAITPAYQRAENKLTYSSCLAKRCRAGDLHHRSGHCPAVCDEHRTDGEGKQNPVKSLTMAAWAGLLNNSICATHLTISRSFRWFRPCLCSSVRYRT